MSVLHSLKMNYIHHNDIITCNCWFNVWITFFTSSSCPHTTISSSLLPAVKSDWPLLSTVPASVKLKHNVYLTLFLNMPILLIILISKLDVWVEQIVKVHGYCSDGREIITASMRTMPEVGDWKRTDCRWYQGRKGLTEQKKENIQNWRTHCLSGSRTFFRNWDLRKGQRIGKSKDSAHPSNGYTDLSRVKCWTHIAQSYQRTTKERLKTSEIYQYINARLQNNKADKIGYINLQTPMTLKIPCTTNKRS